MIGTGKRLDIGNFRLGQRRDGALRDDALLSLRNLVNYDIIYDSGRLKVRYGYERWNTIELPAVCTQLHQFVDLEGNEHFLGILDTSETDSFDQWYVIKESADHVVLRAQGATARKAVIAYGNRCLFCTNSDVWWTDHDAILSGNSYSLGMMMPNEPPAVEEVAATGNIAGIMTNQLYINTTDQYKVGFQFSLAQAETIGSFKISVMKPSAASPAGNVKIGVYADDAGEPSDTLYDADAVSDWWPVMWMPVYPQAIADSLKLFTLRAPVDFEAGTYWIVFTSDASYKQNYVAGGPLPFYCIVGSEQVIGPPYYSAFYDNVGQAWVLANFQAFFQVGGLDDTKWYDYVMTQYNRTYNSESRPTEYVRVQPTSAKPCIEITTPAAINTQADVFRIYRREVENFDDGEADIEDEYKYVGECQASNTITDTMPTANLGAILQTQDHYRYNDVDDTGAGLREAALVPYTMIEWKGRVWFAEEDGNVLYLSKVLEQDGKTGLTGDNCPDYFPLENKLEMPVASGIIGLSVLPGNILAVYFQDESIWVVDGGDQPLNPPPDLSYRELLPNNGLFAVGTLNRVTGGSIFLSREGLYRLSLLGTEYLSETNQTILDLIDNAHLANSILTVNGNEIWLLVDTDSDGDLETILILDLQRDLPTRQLRDRAWRTYKYDVALNDIIVRKQGDTYRGVMAADAENNYILELNTGYLDNLFPIPVEGETHDLEVPGLAGVTGLSIRANYIDVVSSYDVTVTCGDGNPHKFSVMPSAQDDLRGHRAGIRALGSNFVSVKWESSHVRRDEFRGITIDYILEDVQP